MKIGDLVQCSVPLLWENPDPAFPYTVGATGFLIAYCGDFFVVTARHNIRGREIKQLLVPFDAGRRDFLPFESAYFPMAGENEADTDYSDIVLLKVARSLAPCHWLVGPQWFDLHFKRHLPTLSVGDTVLTAGFPLSLQSIDYDASHLRRQRFVVEGTYVGSAASVHCHQIQLTELPDLPKPAVSDEPFSGLSGSPVFAIRSGEGQGVCYLAGVMLRATSSSLMGRFVHSSIVFETLERICAEIITPVMIA